MSCPLSNPVPPSENTIERLLCALHVAETPIAMCQPARTSCGAHRFRSGDTQRALVRMCPVAMLGALTAPLHACQGCCRNASCFGPLRRRTWGGWSCPSRTTSATPSPRSTTASACCRCRTPETQLLFPQPGNCSCMLIWGPGRSDGACWGAGGTKALQVAQCMPAWSASGLPDEVCFQESAVGELELGHRHAGACGDPCIPEKATRHRLLRALQAMVDVAADAGWLGTTLATMRLVQGLMQARKTRMAGSLKCTFLCFCISAPLLCPIFCSSASMLIEIDVYWQRGEVPSMRGAMLCSAFPVTTSPQICKGMMMRTVPDLACRPAGGTGARWRRCRAWTWPQRKR